MDLDVQPEAQGELERSVDGDLLLSVAGVTVKIKRDAAQIHHEGMPQRRGRIRPRGGITEGDAGMRGNHLRRRLRKEIIADLEVPFLYRVLD